MTSSALKGDIFCHIWPIKITKPDFTVVNHEAMQPRWSPEITEEHHILFPTNQRHPGMTARVDGPQNKLSPASCIKGQKEICKVTSFWPALATKL